MTLSEACEAACRACLYDRPLVWETYYIRDGSYINMRIIDPINHRRVAPYINMYQLNHQFKETLFGWLDESETILRVSGFDYWDGGTVEDLIVFCKRCLEEL